MVQHPPASRRQRPYQAAGKMVMDVMKAGGLIVAGTDTPNGFNLHGELDGYVMAGMTPYQALRTATVNSSKALGLDAGSIEAGQTRRPRDRRRKSAGEYRQRASREARDRQWPAVRYGRPSARHLPSVTGFAGRHS